MDQFSIFDLHDGKDGRISESFAAHLYLEHCLQRKLEFRWAHFPGFCKNKIVNIAKLIKLRVRFLHPIYEYMIPLLSGIGHRKKSKRGVAGKKRRFDPVLIEHLGLYEPLELEEFGEYLAQMPGTAGFKSCVSHFIRECNGIPIQSKIIFLGKISHSRQPVVKNLVPQLQLLYHILFP